MKSNLIILIIFCSLFLFGCEVDKSYIETFPQIDTRCEIDADCVIAEKRISEKPCCWNCSYEAISQTVKEQRRQWGADNCTSARKGLDYCGIACKTPPMSNYQAVCDQGDCKKTAKD